MTKSSVDRKRSRYGEKYSLRFHKKLKIYNLSCNDEIPSLIAKFVETDGDLAMGLFERLESNYKEIEQLKQTVNNLKDTIVTIGMAYQKKYGGTLVDLVDGTLEEDIIDLGTDL